jgi:hypothetical protein
MAALGRPAWPFQMRSGENATTISGAGDQNCSLSELNKSATSDVSQCGVAGPIAHELAIKQASAAGFQRRQGWQASVDSLSDFFEPGTPHRRELRARVDLIQIHGNTPAQRAGGE